MNGMTESERHALHSRLIELLGAEPAETLMSHLPPTGWADVATVHTQQQLADQLRAETRQLATELRAEMSELRVELHDGLRRQTFAMLGAMVTISGVVAVGAALG